MQEEDAEKSKIGKNFIKELFVKTAADKDVSGADLLAEEKARQ